jgi:tetratricopeptide (TPR) repeat protein
MNQLFSQNLQSAVAKNKQSTPLSTEIKRSYDEVLNKIIEIEKEDYHNDLMPFTHHEKQIKEKGEEVIAEMTAGLEEAQKALKELFELEEKEHPEIEAEAQFARWEEASKNISGKLSLLEAIESDKDEPLQVQCSLGWVFMDRVYHFAKKLQEDKRLKEAANCYRFLRYLNHRVFEYWLQEANCLYNLGKFQDALEAYIQSLLVLPESPFVLYQIGYCYYELGDLEKSVIIFEQCIELAQNDENYKDLVQTAQDAKLFIASKNGI